MGMKKIYNCDICRDTKSPDELIGCRFSSNKHFELDTAHSTDAAHICKDCLRQLKEQAHPLEI